jgi:hypothetical protein
MFPNVTIDTVPVRQALQGGRYYNATLGIKYLANTTKSNQLGSIFVDVIDGVNLQTESRIPQELVVIVQNAFQAQAFPNRRVFSAALVQLIAW